VRQQLSKELGIETICRRRARVPSLPSGAGGQSESPRGEQMQIDCGQTRVLISGAAVRLFLFVRRWAIRVGVCMRIRPRAQVRLVRQYRGGIRPLWPPGRLAFRCRRTVLRARPSALTIASRPNPIATTERSSWPPRLQHRLHSV